MPTTPIIKRAKRTNKSPSKCITPSDNVQKARAISDSKARNTLSAKPHDDTATHMPHPSAGKPRKSPPGPATATLKPEVTQPATNAHGRNNKSPRKPASTPVPPRKPVKLSKDTPDHRDSTTSAVTSKNASPASRKQKPMKKDGGSSAQPPALVNKFSLKAEEQPQRAAKSAAAARRKKGKEASDLTQPSSGDDHAENDDADTTPDVLFQKKMTQKKLDLINASPLAKLISEERKDAAAEEVYGKGTKFETIVKRERRDSDDGDDDDIIPLDPTVKNPVKKAKLSNAAEAERRDAVSATTAKREARKLRRKVRQLRSRGELPTTERELTEPGVMYLGHIPHGFYEKEMHGYFSQYGEVTRIRLSRSKKTARSRGFAFIEFADKDVAMAAAKSMDGYLMHGQSLVVKMVDPEKVHPDTFKGANRPFRKIPFAAMERRALIQRSRDPLKLAERSRGVRKNLNNKKQRLANMKIRYDFPQISPSTEPDEQNVSAKLQ